MILYTLTFKLQKIMKIELLQYTPNPEELIEKAARTCYKSPSKPETRDKFLRGVIKSGHESVIEHASATFKISEVSRALTHQLVRHRVASYSQESQRYCTFEKSYGNVLDDWFVTPTSILENSNDEVRNVYRETMECIEDAYRKLVDSGIKAEDARFLLPNAAKTEIVCTMNFREWRHFLKLRCDSHAQWEIRDLANEILSKLYSIAPSIFEDLYQQYLSK